MPEKKPEKSTKKTTKKPTSRSAAATRGAPSDASPPDLERPPSELIVLARPEAALRAHHGELASAAAADVSPLAKVLGRHGAALTPLFGVGEERLQREASALALFAEAVPPDLSTFYRVDDVAEEDKEQLAEELRELELVEAAYVKPPAEPAGINDQVAAPQEAPPATPDFISRQGYLRPAPGGIDAEYAWTLTGGGGAEVRVIDIEGAWRFSHEDLVQNQGGVIGGTQSSDLLWRNHGTAVVGVIGADRNDFGVVGIAPDANVRAISIFGGLGSAQAIRQAALALQPGDIILLELHRPGPRFGFQLRGDQRGYIDIEWWPDDYAAVRFATGRGVIVVAAAGNGGEDLDDAIYDNPAPGFPAAWGNPFRRGANDSGSIVVGAGAPPPGTHGRNHGADRSRLGFSNWGAVVDAQGWGREVTTTGYGDLQGGGNEDLWYTDTFSGTSSASPIVVSALAAVQGILRARSRAPLTPARARQCLRTTGSPQQDEPGRPATQRIGNRPDLRQLVRCAIGPVKVKEIKELKEGKEFKEIKEKDRKELKEWKEFKEKDRKELKEKDLKEKDLKEIREKIRDVFDRDVFRRDVFERADVEPGTEPHLDERVRELERRVGELSHFIAGELRPDLTHSALRQEGDEDAEALSRELADRAESAKRAKDDKDVEKLREG